MASVCTCMNDEYKGEATHPVLELNDEMEKVLSELGNGYSVVSFYSTCPYCDHTIIEGGELDTDGVMLFSYEVEDGKEVTHPDTHPTAVHDTQYVYLIDKGYVTTR